MLNISFRKHGESPYRVVVVHGGPGAPGSAEPIAKNLSSDFSVLEPFQSKKSLNGQVDELYKQITDNCELPVVLIGWSWGAWLVYILAAKYSKVVNKIILIGSGAFENQYVKEMNKKRMSRLSQEEKDELDKLMKKLKDPTVKNKNKVFGQFGKLFTRTDTFEIIESLDKDTIEGQFDIYDSVWPEGARARKTGRLLEHGKKIQCPVIAIHGDYDPTPANGVRKPLKKVLNNFKFVLLKKCGHSPWLEKHAKDKFLKILKKEIMSALCTTSLELVK